MSSTWRRARSSATARPPPDLPHHPERGPAPCQTPPRIRVLIIEDERDLVGGLKYNLERDGYVVAVAHDGQDGLRKAQTQLPDLIETVHGVGYRFREAAD